MAEYSNRFTYVNHNGVYDVMLGDRKIGEMFMEVDGFYVFAEEPFMKGYWDEWILLELGNKLKELNTEWEAQIARDLDMANSKLSVPEIFNIDFEG